jgi:hypothetical protein
MIKPKKLPREQSQRARAEHAKFFDNSAYILMQNNANHGKSEIRNTEKGCLYIKKLNDVDITILKKMIEWASKAPWSSRIFHR